MLIVAVRRHRPPR